MYYQCSENKGEADLRLCFRKCKNPVFSRRGSYDGGCTGLFLVVHMCVGVYVCMCECACIHVCMRSSVYLCKRRGTRLKNLESSMDICCQENNVSMKIVWV